MTLLVSTDGGTHFSPIQDIAGLADEYGGFGTTRVAIADDGTGFITFQDANGLEVANLQPTAAQYAGLHRVGDSLPVSVTCLSPQHPCTAKLSLTLKSAAVNQSFSLGAGVTRSLKLTLTPAALTVLEHGHTRGTLRLSLASHGTSLYRLVLHPTL